MVKLKTCPFCGGRPYLEESQRGFVNGKSTHVCFVRCSVCNARSERVDLSDYGCSSYCGDAIKIVSESWNNRVEDTETVEIMTKRDKYEKKKSA